MWRNWSGRVEGAVLLPFISESGQIVQLSGVNDAECERLPHQAPGSANIEGPWHTDPAPNFNGTLVIFRKRHQQFVIEAPKYSLRLSSSSETKQVLEDFTALHPVPPRG